LSALDRRLVAFHAAADAAADADDADVLTGALAAVARAEAERERLTAALDDARARLDVASVEPDVNASLDAFGRLQAFLAGRVDASDTIAALNATLRALVARCEIRAGNFGGEPMLSASIGLSRAGLPLNAGPGAMACADFGFGVPLDDEPGELPAWLGPRLGNDGSQITEPLTSVQVQPPGDTRRVPPGVRIGALCLRITPNAWPRGSPGCRFR
jgi:hypothetical protein